VIAPLAQIAGGGAQPLDRAVFGFVAEAPLDRPPQRTAHAFLRVTQLRVQPRGECFFEDAIGLRVGEHRKGGVDACFHGAFAEQLRAKTVDGADLRFFEVMRRGVE
jgi:hypothetical protein